jgi:hypothetical protein
MIEPKHATLIWFMTKAYKILFGESEQKTRLGRRNLRHEDNIKIVLKEIGCENMDWFYPALYTVQWRALANTVLNL